MVLTSTVYIGRMLRKTIESLLVKSEGCDPLFVFKQVFEL